VNTVGEDGAEAAAHANACEKVASPTHILVSPRVITPIGVIERVLHVFGKGDIAMFPNPLKQKTF
jgi:hypothetical protein